jgi:hypothetical protein
MEKALKLSDDACIEVLHKWSGLGEMKRTTHMDKLLQYDSEDYWGVRRQPGG